jgi:hypothetical protein
MAVCLGLVGSSWPTELPAQAERVGEMGIFWLVGALAASFFDQQKRYTRDIENANDNTLLALASSLDVREHNTGVHSQRVADYTLRLARQMGVRDGNALDIFWRGALLHDVGEDRHPRRGAPEAGRADRRGVAGDADAPHGRREHLEEDRFPSRAGGDRPFPP